jgi:hypothetical protein
MILKLYPGSKGVTLTNRAERNARSKHCGECSVTHHFKSCAYDVAWVCNNSTGKVPKLEEGIYLATRLR